MNRTALATTRHTCCPYSHRWCSCLFSPCRRALGRLAIQAQSDQLRWRSETQAFSVQSYSWCPERPRRFDPQKSVLTLSDFGRIRPSREKTGLFFRICGRGHLFCPGCYPRCKGKTARVLVFSKCRAFCFIQWKRCLQPSRVFGPTAHAASPSRR